MIYQATILAPGGKTILFVFEAQTRTDARRRAETRTAEHNGQLVDLQRAGQAQAAAFATIKASATFPIEAKEIAS